MHKNSTGYINCNYDCKNCSISYLYKGIYDISNKEYYYYSCETNKLGDTPIGKIVPITIINSNTI